MIGAAAGLGLAFLLSACGGATTGPNAGSENDGVYVKLNGLYYQLQVSRELNQFSPEDHSYLMGLPSSPPGALQIWYGVFLRAMNYTDQSHPTASTFDIRDTQGNVYHPVTLNPAKNSYGWTPSVLRPLGTEPAADTTASYGPTQGSLILFKLSTSVYANRPLTLDIHS